MSASEPINASSIAGDFFRQEATRLVATLTARLGTHRLQLAEDVVQEALLRALKTWPYRGIPENPGAWLTQVAKNLALDVLRREQRLTAKAEGLAIVQETWLNTPEPMDAEGELLRDDTLRMLFVCFHPQLAPEAQCALALRTVCGLSAGEIAAAFFASEAAISKRLVRARQRIRELNLPFAVPGAAELPARLEGVLSTLYLLFNEGYKTSGEGELVREDLCREAIRLASLLAQHPMTSQPATSALLALMHLNASRLPARSDAEGRLLRLHEQNRALWNHEQIHQGLFWLAKATAGDSLSHFHLEAGIAACHCLAPEPAATDWPRILSLYDQLLAMKPTPVVAMNRAVAVSHVNGIAAGLLALDSISQQADLQSNHLYHVVRASFSAKLGETAAAIAHYRQAAALASVPAEKEFIALQLREAAEEQAG